MRDTSKNTLNHITTSTARDRPGVSMGYECVEVVETFRDVDGRLKTQIRLALRPALRVATLRD
jgi:hypothetical protein